MPVTKVRSRWASGVLEFYDPATGNTIISFDGPNRKVLIPSGSSLEAAGLGLDTTELGLLDGATAGVVLASKAASYDASGKLLRQSASPAAAGTLISDATALTAELNAVTGANGTAGVKLPVAVVNASVVVINTNASNNLLVYPVAGSQINALGASNAFTVTPGQIAIFIARSTTLWYVAAATDTIAGLTASAAELNLNDGTTAGTVVASKTVAVDAQRAVDTVRATTTLNVGGTGVPGAAAVQTEITKQVTGLADTVATAVLTVTVPNAQHAAVIDVDVVGILGAGGAIGAGEATRNSRYQVVLARTAGVNVVATASAAVGGAAATVAGGGAITSVVVTLSGITGGVGASNTFDILVAITRSGAGATNHVALVAARIVNQNATGVTMA